MRDLGKVMAFIQDTTRHYVYESGSQKPETQDYSDNVSFSKLMRIFWGPCFVSDSPSKPKYYGR